MPIPYAPANLRIITELKKNSQNIPLREVIFAFSDVKMATAEVIFCTKKTKRTISSLQLAIVRLETKNTYYDLSNKLHKTEEGESTTPEGSKCYNPPPSKAFSRFKNFYQYGKFNICGNLDCNL